MKTPKDILQNGIYKSDKPENKRFSCKVTAEQFSKEFLNSIDFDFVIDDNNRPVINQLFYYLNKSELFSGDIEKGVLLIGGFGSGKTVIMDSFCYIVREFSSKVITKIQSRELIEIAKSNETTYYKRPLYIDDVGKEPMEVIDYGSALRPFEDLLDIRYRNNGITFGTSNLKMEDMQYNGHTKDRIKQMFNIIVLPGKSRRT